MRGEEERIIIPTKKENKNNGKVIAFEQLTSHMVMNAGLETTLKNILNYKSLL